MIASAPLRSTLCRLAAGTALVSICLAHPIAAHAAAGGKGVATPPNLPTANLPVGGSVVSGSATITTNPGLVTISQTTSRAIVNWSAFNVAAGNTVVFNQPNASGATLNRVTGTTASTIAGQITSNGAVYLVNPNGIAITSTGKVQTGGGFIASTLDIANKDFNAGKLAFTGSGSSKAVTNAGTITTSAGGYVALLGGSVSNAGTISVPAGKVALGSGESLALDLNGGGFLQVAVPSNLAGASVSNSGTITASGGRIELRAATAASAVRNVINMTGTLSADSATGDGGSIVLLGGDGGTTSVTGTISAKATGATGNGGFVETSGAAIDFTGLKVDTSAAAGTAGTWLIDPVDLTVDAAAASTIATNLASGNVTLQTTATTATGTGNQTTGNGDIVVNSGITWTSANTLSLLAYNNIALNAAISGANGGLTITAGNGVANTGAISDTAAVSVKTFNLTNGAWSQIASTLPAFSATDFRITPANASFLRATGGTGTSADPWLITDVYGLQGMASSTLLANGFKLANAIDASGTAAWNGNTGFLPIGTNGSGSQLGNGFAGTFDGQGFAVSNLTINTPNTNFAALFGVLGSIGTISNVAVTNATVSGSNYVGALVGLTSGGSITNAMSSGTVTGNPNGAASIGGLVGNQISGTIASSSSSAIVTGANTVGGLVGSSGGTIAGSFATGTVSANGAVNNYFGGLVGQSTGAITDSYATGAVTNPGGGSDGGLAGRASGLLTNVSATGAVKGSISVGGLVGSTGDGFSVKGAYATGNVIGSAGSSASAA